MSRSWKEITSEEDLSEISVTLKPILGVTPLVWVPTLWGLAALGFLFWLLLLPGLRNYGSVVTFVSSPAGAGVFVDETRIGSTPVEVFVPAGVRTVTVTMPGLPPQTSSVAVAGRRFASRFFPRRERVDTIFEPTDPDAIARAGVASFASWSLGSEPGGQFQHPPVARDASRLLWAATPAAEGERDSVLAYVADLLAHAEPWQAAEVVGSALRAANPGGAVQPGSVAEVVQYFIHLDTHYPGFYRVLTDLIPMEREGTGAALEAWIAQRNAELSTELLTLSVELDEGLIPPPTTMVVAGLTFVRVPAGRYAVGYPLRDPGKTGVISTFSRDFWIMQDEFSRRDYARFIAAHPEWAPRHGDTSRDSVAYYLDDWPDDWDTWLSGPPSAEGMLPVRHVPVTAAEAVARWVEREARQSGTPLGMNASVRLPTPVEWEYAAFLNGPAGSVQSGVPRSGPEPAGSGPTGALAARHLSGNLWEWTTDWYGKSGEVLVPRHGAHRVVMGGSFANSDQRHDLRGSQPPDWATPFLGFRLVLVSGEQNG